MGYDTGSDGMGAEEGHSPLHYISPGLLQLGGGDHHGGQERSLLPGARQGELEGGRNLARKEYGFLMYATSLILPSHQTKAKRVIEFIHHFLCLVQGLLRETNQVASF